MSQHAQSDAQLADQIRAVSQANRKVYGSPRVHAELQAEADHLRAQAGGSSYTRAGTGWASASPSNHNHAKRS